MKAVTLRWRVYARAAGKAWARAHRYAAEASEAWESPAWGAWGAAEDADHKASQYQLQARRLDTQARNERAALLALVAVPS